MENKILLYINTDGSIKYVKDPVKAGKPEYLSGYKGPVFWDSNEFVSDRTKRNYCVLWVPRDWDIDYRLLNYTALMNGINDKNFMKKLESTEIIEPIDVSHLSNKIFVEKV